MLLSTIPRIRARVLRGEQLGSYALELRHFYFIRGVALQPLAKQIGQHQKAFFMPYQQISLPLFRSFRKREGREGGCEYFMFCDWSLSSGRLGLKYVLLEIII